MNIQAFLKTVFLFSELTNNEIATVCLGAKEIRLKKNALLFSENDSADYFYVMAFGKVRVFKISRAGDEQTLHVQEKGELIAEATIFGKDRYPASAKAIEDSLLIQITKKDFINTLLSQPKLSLKLMAGYSNKLKNFVDMIEYLSLSDPYERVTKYILKNSQKHKKEFICPIKTSKKDLANFLGITPETLSRTLNKLKKQNLIKEKDKTLIIPNPDKLYTL